MARFRKETRRFKDRASNSLMLAIEFFNRPNDRGRVESVLILLHHSFEMLLKSIIYEKRGKICETRADTTYSFNRCIGIARSDLNVIGEDEAKALSMLKDLRDCATHHLIDLTEQALYVHAQVAVSLFDKILYSFFAEHLADNMPTRVLPVSTSPPTDMLTFVNSEFSQIRELLRPGRRSMAEASGRLRHLMVMESNITGDGGQPNVRETERVARRVREGDIWQAIFPGIAGVRLDTQGHGLNVSIRFTREPQAAPVRVVREGDSDLEQATLVREVNLLDRYSMNVTQLAHNVGLTIPRTLALILFLGIQEDNVCYKEFIISRSQTGSGVLKRYSPRAQQRLLEALSTVDMNAVWIQYRSRLSQARQ